MSTGAWLVKQEPEAYSWDAFMKDGRTAWTGVRNFQARNNLRAMKADDWVCYYHSGEDRKIVGIARVAKAAYADPTAEDGDWSAVDLEPKAVLKAPIPLAAIKSDAVLSTMPWVRQSRLSVASITLEQFARVLDLGGLSSARFLKNSKST